jgi:exonuclease VII small subunit
MDFSNGKFKVTQSSRLYFKGEETILKLQTELKEARERIKELDGEKVDVCKHCGDLGILKDGQNCPCHY